MTARQQIARLLPLGLLVVLVIAGLRGAVPAPGWNWPLRAYGTPIGIGLEVLCVALLIVVRARARAAARAAERRPYTAEVRDIEPAAALRYTLSYVLGLCVIAIAVVLISNLHLHFFTGHKGQGQPPLSKLDFLMRDLGAWADANPRLRPLLKLAVDRFLTVPDPRLAVLRDTPRLFLAVHIHLTGPA